MKVLITGTPGSGKTTAIQELVQRGYAAYDTDELSEVTRLQLRETGQIVDWPEGFVDWQKYDWNWQEDGLKKLLAAHQTVFIGAIVSNQQSFYHLFDAMFVLTIDDNQLLNRLVTRTNHDYNNDPANTARTVSRNELYIAQFLAAGATAVANDQSIRQTIDTLLAKLQLPKVNSQGQ